METKVLQILRRLSKIKFFLLTFLIALTALQINAQNHVVYNFDTDGDTEGWYGSGTTMSAASGVLTVSVNTGVGYPGIKVDGLSLDASVYTQLEMTIVNTTTMNTFQLWHWDGTVKSAAKDEQTGVGDISELLTFSTIDNGAGIIEGFFIRFKQGNPAPTTGSLVIDQIRILSLNDGGISYDLTTNVVGFGEINPSSGSFAENSVQSITAIPYFGNVFSGWSGDLSGSTNPESITMDANKNVTATFTAIPNFDYNWGFNTDGDSEGWSNTNSTGSVGNGVDTMKITHSAPKMTVGNIRIPTDDYGVIEIRIKNNTDVTGGVADNGNYMKYWFVGDNGSSGTFSNYRSIDDESVINGVTVTANDTEFKTYQIKTNTLEDDGSTPVEGGYFTDVTFFGPKNVTPTDGTKTVEIDYIKFIKRSAQTITFDAISGAEIGDTIIVNKFTDGNLKIKYVSSDSSIVDVSTDTLFMVGVGSATITASQEGDHFYYAATDVAQGVTVTKASQSITFNALAAKTTLDADFDLNATASSGLAVSYTSSDETVATISGNTVTIVGAGTSTITAAQAGNDTYNAATSVEQSLVVTKVDQSITFEALDAKTMLDVDFDLTATASSGLAVTYTSSDETVATISGNTVSIVGAGTTTITASQGGDNNYNAATSVEQSLVVAKVDQTITFEVLPGKLIGDAAFDLTATASSSLDITYTSSNENIATISGSTVTIIGAGSTSITASQAGNDVYNAAEDVVQELLVTDPSKLDQTITFDSLPAKTIDDAAFDLTATASSSLAVSYTSSDETVATISGSTVSIVGEGTTTITASQEGDDTYNAAPSVSWKLVVNKLAQTITFDSLPKKTYGDAPFALKANASSGLEITYTSSDTTVVSIKDSIVTIKTPGTTTITATQTGNEMYSAAKSVAQVLTITQGELKTQTITFDSLPAKTIGDAAFELMASASSGLEVAFISSDADVAQVSGTTVTIMGAGTTTITASQAGNFEFAPAVNVSQILIVNKIEQTITFDALGEKTLGDEAFDLVAIASSDLTVTYSSSDTTIATINGSTVTIVGAGITTITASQAGDSIFAAAADVAQQLVVNDTIDAVITSTPVITAIVDSMYTYVIDTVGVATLMFETSDSVSWLTLSNGVLSGTPTYIDTVDVKLTYGTYVQEFSIIVTEPVIPEIVSEPITEAVVDALYEYEVEVLGDATLELVTEASWLSLNNNLLSGTPTEAGEVEVTLTYGDDAQTFTIIVNESSVTAAITSDPVTTGKVNELYEYQITTEGEGILAFETDMATDWLSLDANGLLSGIPSEAGTIHVTITFSEAVQEFDLVIEAGNAIAEDGLSQMKIYPNPASDFITINNVSEGSTIKIYNALGVIMYDKDAADNNMILNISMFQEGLYFIAVSKGNFHETKQLLINK